MNLSVARRSPIVVVIAMALFLATCRTLQRVRGPLHAELRTDSTDIGVRFGGEVYVAKIGFVLVNTTAGPISHGGCGILPLPQVEKLVNASWVAAYYPIDAACRTFPDLSLASGAAYRNQIDFTAAPRGGRSMPALQVDSINGVYRLHWTWYEGASRHSPLDQSPRRPVEAISNQFRMILR